MALNVYVKAATVTADGDATTTRAAVKGLNIITTATAGSVVLKNGGSGGAALLTVNTPAVAGMHDVFVPDDGILFADGVYVDVTNVTSVTVFYAG